MIYLLGYLAGMVLILLFFRFYRARRDAHFMSEEEQSDGFYLRRIRWPEFVERVEERLNTGAKEYGEDGWTNKSFRELAGEVEEEALDICGWAFLLWLKIREVKIKAKILDGSEGD